MELTSLSVIRPIMERHGFDFTKSLGQNFLIDPTVPRRIAEEGVRGAEGECCVIEIGAGVGCLTKELALRAKKVISYEIDKKLIPVLGETLAEFDNVTVVNADILKTNLAETVKEYGLSEIRVCANLPYYITTPVLMKLLEEPFGAEQITVMIQKEVADRLTSSAGSAEYGAVTASVQYYADCEKVFNVSPACFVPRPKVTSTVLTLSPRPPRVEADQDTLFRVIRSAFAMRRKTLANNLAAGFSMKKEEATAMLVSLGFSPTVRGEDLCLEEYAKIANYLHN